MPAAIDLTGARFGALTVVKFGGLKRYAGKDARFWWCRCDCGREDLVYQQHLSSGRIRQCQVCRRGPCVVCGGPILRATRSNTCCAVCKAEKLKAQGRQSYHRRAERDPELNKRRADALTAKRKKDPVYDQMLKDREKAAKRRYRDANPDYVEKMAEKRRQYYEKHRDIILEKRRRRLETLSEDDLAAIKARDRERGREWRANWREQIAEDPTLYAEYLRYQRAAFRRHRAKKALAEINKVTQELREVRDDGTHNQTQ